LFLNDCGSAKGKIMKFLILLVLIIAGGCSPPPSSPPSSSSSLPPFVKYVEPPIEGSKINVINDGSRYGFRIVEVTHNNKTHFFLWNYGEFQIEEESEDADE
jgi:hypothetical protein